MLDFLKTLDRRWIFLAMFLAVSVPILVQTTFPEQPTLHVRSVFQEIEGLPDGSTIMISFDYDPGTTGELGPMATALLRHCCLKRHKMIFLTLFETGSPVIHQAIQDIIDGEFADLELKSGEDYVNLGFKPGREVIITVIGISLRQAFPADDDGTSLDDLPLTKNIVNLKDMKLIISLSAGYPGWKEWVQYAASPHGIKFAAGVTAVGAPQAYPYIPGQMLGILAAVKGAAEYEAALGEKYPQYKDPKLCEGIQRMAPQFWGHLLIISLIILGNCIHFADRLWGSR